MIISCTNQLSPMLTRNTIHGIIHTRGRAKKNILSYIISLTHDKNAKIIFKINI